MLSCNYRLISLVFSKFSKLPESRSDEGNFVKTLKILVKLILNCPRAHAITYTYGSHLARLHRRRRRRRRRRAYAPTSNTASHDNHEKINSWVSFCFPYMGCLWGSAWRPFRPSELRYYLFLVAQMNLTKLQQPNFMNKDVSPKIDVTI